jgi:hypothetical protein
MLRRYGKLYRFGLQRRILYKPGQLHDVLREFLVHSPGYGKLRRHRLQSGILFNLEERGLFLRPFVMHHTGHQKLQRQRLRPQRRILRQFDRQRHCVLCELIMQCCIIVLQQQHLERD